MKRFLLAMAAILAFVFSASMGLCGDGSSSSPYVIGVVYNTLSFTEPGFDVGVPAKYFQFSIYDTAPAGGVIDISYSAGDGTVGYLLALYSGSTRIAGGTLGYTSSTTVRCRITLATNLQPGTYKLQVGVGGETGASGPNITFNFALGNSSTPVTLIGPTNRSPVNHATDQSNSPRLAITAYGANNGAGTPVASEWAIRRASDNYLFVDAVITGTYNAVNVSSLPTSTLFYWQARYQNNLSIWTPWSAATYFTTASVWPPQITATVVNGLAVKSPLKRGLVRVSRTISTGTTTVLLNIAGTAVPATDYQALASSVTFLPGVKNIDLSITPIPNLVYSGKRTVLITPQPVTGFTVSGTSANLAIRSNLLPSRLMVREGNQFLFDMTGNGGTPGKVLALGSGTNGKVLYGDFNRDGADDIVLRSGTAYTISMSGSTGVRSQTIAFGAADSQAFIGDYDSNGTDELIVRRGNQFTVDTRHLGGNTGVPFTFGLASDKLVLTSDGVRTGDWDGDGRDDIFLRRGNVYLVRLSRNGATISFTFGGATDSVYLADMNGDGKSEPVVSNNTGAYRANVNHTGLTPLVLNFGLATDHAYAADLNGDGRAELIIKRFHRYLIDSGNNGGAAEKAEYFGLPTDSVWFPRQ